METIINMSIMNKGSAAERGTNEPWAQLDIVWRGGAGQDPPLVKGTRDAQPALN